MPEQRYASSWLREKRDAFVLVAMIISRHSAWYPIDARSFREDRILVNFHADFQQ
jgi:hypothetical protein